MKLQILVPQYNESEEVIKPLLDSLALQQRVDFNEIGVIIVNDGGEYRIDPVFFSQYPFQVLYFQEPHKGVSAARNACLDYATADYVMFCDIDDMFYNMCGLWIIFNEIDNCGGFDSLVSNFIEETRVQGTDQVIYVNHELDSTFVHGKVHKRKYLLDNDIRFNPDLTIHEDSYFNILAQNCSKDVKYCQSPFYLWRWRDESVCRHDPKYILKTYKNMLDSNDALVDNFIRRGNMEKAIFYCSFIIFDAYYNMNKPEWINQENAEYRHMTELRFKDYFAKHKSLWEQMEQPQKMQLSNGVRTRIVNEGMMMESITIDDWLKKVEEME